MKKFVKDSMFSSNYKCCFSLKVAWFQAAQYEFLEGNSNLAHIQWKWLSLNQLLRTFLRSWLLVYWLNPLRIGWFEMSISVKLKFQFYTELELLKVAAGTFDPTPTLLGLSQSRIWNLEWSKVQKCTIIADIIVQFSTSLHSKFQIRDWLKLMSACNLTNLRSADVNLSQSRIWNLEWSEVQKFNNSVVFGVNTYWYMSMKWGRGQEAKQITL